MVFVALPKVLWQKAVEMVGDDATTLIELKEYKEGEKMLIQPRDEPIWILNSYKVIFVS